MSRARILVTGGAGFIGSNFIHYILHGQPDWELTNLDKLTYAGKGDNLRDVEADSRYQFVRGDIKDRPLLRRLFQKGYDYIVNFAAESHVDRSIMDSSPFIETNVKGVQALLETARESGVKTFLQVSTDEVYGPLGDHGAFDENAPLKPTNPYAASKAAGDLLCQAYFATHRLPMIITRCSNNFGPHQYPEKLIPLTIANALEDKPIPVYGNGQNVRDWIYVEDHCHALEAVLLRGKVGEVYNVSAQGEQTNLALVRAILNILGKPLDLITFVKDRPGHDFRYALDSGKLRRELGWAPARSFQEALRETVEWYVSHREWWERLRTRPYSRYYRQWYGQRQPATTSSKA